MDIKHIRNFSIIAHIDHGKTTLSDRLLEQTGALSSREMSEQVLDDMDLERERGITIKAHAVRLNYTAKDGQKYVFNLIDTPGHVDFTYEVSRSLTACEGVLLIVDATQGVEAQTLANAYLAIDNNLEIIPIINKIDLPSADVERARTEIEDVIGIDASEAIAVSAKEGTGIPETLESIIKMIPPPVGDADKPLKALIFDSWFDNYQGVIILIRVFDGVIRKGMKIKFFTTEKVFEVMEVGHSTPKLIATGELSAGEVGYVIAGIKKVADSRIGDTITTVENPTTEPLPGYREVKAMVFCGLYPTDTGQYEDMRDALEKLKLNDSSFSYEPETSIALGFGFRCGFLGLLHMEISQERLEREFGLTLLSTAPTVVYRVVKTDGEVLVVDNPAKLPDVSKIERMEEPIIQATIMVPNEYIGSVLALCQERRGIQKGLSYIDSSRAIVTYELPLNEIVLDFYDKLKSVSRGYASLDYELMGYRASNLVKLDILLNGEAVDALSLITHRDKAIFRGRELAVKLRELIPRQMFEVAIQAAIGNKVIARETVKPMRKDVIAKCYGGDISRKRKLLEKQKEGKKKMKQIGTVEIPQEAFLAILNIKD